jgi:hypothetical protein
MSFLTALQAEGTKNARTANGAVTHSTSTNAVLDFFALAGAMRNNVNQAKTLFRKAYAEDRQLAVRALFYLRDVRGGQGERDLFRTLFRELIRMDRATAENVFSYIPEYGRWDDVVSLYGNMGSVATSLIQGQFLADINDYELGKSVSLMGKWLPSENASSANSRVMARQIATDLELSFREYRKATVKLRKYIGLLEQKMSEQDWDAIDYGKLPSQASRKHVKAFKRHDEDRYDAFLTSVLSGESKMNAGTVATYEVLDVVRKGNDKAANAIWSSLPDYTNGSNALVVADTSGSMYSWGWTGNKSNTSATPLDVSTSLALYFAEHNTGPFQGYFLTFSERPELVKVAGKTLTEKLAHISRAHWGMSTNIEALFDLILSSAQKAGANAEDIPKVLYIVSDMEFNSVRGGGNETNYEAAKRKFNAAGFELPHVVFWNVNATNTNVPATAAANNVTLVSGLSQSTFRYVLEGKTPVDSMLDILNGERYEQIVVE